MKRVVKRGLIKECKRLRKEARRLEIEEKEVTKRLIRIRELLDASDMFSLGKAAEDAGMNVEEFMQSKVWIVENHEEKDINLIEFFGLVRDEEKPKRMVLNKMLEKGNVFIGDDGKEVHLEPGSLVFVGYKVTQVDLPSTKTTEVQSGTFHAFRIANLGPRDEKGKIQYQLALSKLGLGIKPYVDSISLETDGQFREESKKGKDVN